MQLVRPTIAIAVLVLASVLVAACGGNASMSPVGPSSPRSGGASITGTIRGTAVTPLRTLNENAFTTLETRSGVTVSVAGTGISTTPDNQGQFTLNNVPAGTVTLNFTGPGSNATVTLSGVGANDRVQITVTVNGNSAHIDSEHHNNGEIEGRITSIDANAKTFVVGKSTVTTTGSTVIRHGSKTVQFGDLKVGDHVEVRGPRDGTTVTASEIKVEEDGEDDDDDDDDHEAELKGTVSGLTTGCPGITFTIRGTKVTADNGTVYRGTSCNSIKNDLRVEVEGIRQSDGVLARKISIDD
jgi:Domain of unknown function (DUF5666)